MPRKTVKMSQTIHQQLCDYADKKKIKSLGKAIQSLLHKDKHTRTLELEVERLQGQLSQQETQPKTQDVPQCRRRINYLDRWFCVQTDRKGLNRLREIPILEICNICKLEKYQIPQSSEVKQHQQIATEIRDPNREGYKKAGMRYCPNAGMWVFVEKCRVCKTKCKEAEP